MLNLRRGPGAYALLSRADGPGRASTTTPTWACGRPARTSTTAGRRAPADQAGQGLLPRQVLRVPGPRAGDHPWQAAQRAERRRGLRAQGLAAGERAGRGHEAPGAPHGGAGGAAGQAAGGGLARAAPSCSSQTYFLDPEGHWVVSTQSTRYRNSEAQTCAKDSTYVGVDVVRCRRNGLANAPFPLPILCPADGVEPVDGVLPDLGFVEGCCDARQSCLNLLPYVGPGWYWKVSLAAMLDLGVCRWDHIVLGISARSHVDAATLRRALERMDAAWQGEERVAKLSVNAMIGLWARSTEVGLRLRAEAAEQRHLPPHPRRGAGL